MSIKLNGRTILLYLAYTYNNDWNKIFEHIKNKQNFNKEDAEKVMEENDFSHAITLVDEDYPESLKKIAQPPFVIYYKGEKQNLYKGNYIYLEGYTNSLYDCERFVTVDNESVIHLGTDLEITTDTKSISTIHTAVALCEKVLIGSNARSKQATLVVTCALEWGLDVYAFPTEESSLNNNLIKEGANLVDCPEDLL